MCYGYWTSGIVSTYRTFFKDYPANKKSRDPRPFDLADYAIGLYDRINHRKNSVMGTQKWVLAPSYTTHIYRRTAIGRSWQNTCSVSCRNCRYTCPKVFAKERRARLTLVTRIPNSNIDSKVLLINWFDYSMDILFCPHVHFVVINDAISTEGSFTCEEDAWKKSYNSIGLCRNYQQKLYRERKSICC